MVDPCENLNNINFDSDEDLEPILLRDKHTRIEGLCAETFFYEQIIQDKFDTCSSSWWFGFKYPCYTVSKLTLSTDLLTSLDFELLEHFSKHNRNTYIIEFCQSERKFYYVRYENGRADTIKKQWAIIKKVYPRKENKAMIPLPNERQEDRLKQSIVYLKSKGVLKKCVIERIFANCWLGGAFSWDIDFFVKYKNTIVAIEVKQKYPTAKGTWGLNVGLANLFKYLSSIDIDVINVILTKPVSDHRIPAINLYTKPEYSKDAKWIATKFSSSLLSHGIGLAPAKTSIHGSSKLSFYHLLPTSFSLIKDVCSDSNQILEFLHDQQSLKKLLEADQLEYFNPRINVPG